MEPQATALKYQVVKYWAVIDDIIAELERQEQKWGTDRVHEPALWAVVLGEEYGEVCRALLERDPDAYVAELIDVAAVAISALRSVILEKQGVPMTRTCETSTLHLTRKDVQP